ncbi:SitA5 family polymorphic toxin [Melittangium boletus]|uniref:SitA5 family polymorphic toxin n=1 Tax=Melittangium boletus TaxID=83453 RepID=UPI003DA4B64E
MACACSSNRGRLRVEEPRTTQEGVSAPTHAPALVIQEAPSGRLVARPPLKRRPPVPVDQAQFAQAMSRLAAELPRAPAPILTRLSLHWAPPDARKNPDRVAHDYQQWCTQRGRSADCLSLLSMDLHLDEDERTDMALMLAFENLWPGVEAAVKASIDPDQLRVAIFTSLSLYLGLLLLPEPTSKLIAVSMTGVLLAYLGADTLVSLVEGYRQLKADALRARSFSELRAAGEHYGQIIGVQAGQVLVMVATAAIGWGSQMTMKGPGLPGFSDASHWLKVETGLNLAQVTSELGTVLVARPGITLTLTAPVAYMATRGVDGDADSQSGEMNVRPVRPARTEEWRKPRLTEDGYVLPYKGTRSPPDPIVNLGRNRAGKTLTNGKDTVRFDEHGFAEFQTRFETLLDNSHIGSSRADMHFRAANKQLHEAIQVDSGLAKRLGLSSEEVASLPTSRKPPPGYTWHHHQDVGRMQLITDSAHDLAKPHTGGMAIWGGGY